MPRTLIVYLHGIGDNIMLSGVLKEYCKQHPEEIIDLFVLNPGCAALWEHNPLVNSATVYPGPPTHFWNPLKYYFVHQWVVRRFIRKVNSNGRYARVILPTIQTIPEIFYHITGTYGRHKIDRICHDLGVPPQLYPYDLHSSADEAAEAENLLKKFSGRQLAVLHPFSGHTRKRISAAGFGQILSVLQARGFATLVVGSAGEQPQFDPSWKTESLFGRRLGVLIEVLKRAALFTGTDSSVAHFAAFANTPRIVIFSPKLEPRRYLPISPHSRITTIRIKEGRESRSLQQLKAALDA